MTLFVTYKGKQRYGIFVQLKYLNHMLGSLLISNYMQGQAALTQCIFDKVLPHLSYKYTVTLMLPSTQV